MISIWVILIIFWVHFVADFMLQSDAIALAKSSDNQILTWHVFLYIIPFLLIFGPIFALLNFMLHWITDYFSSRATAKLYKAGKRHWFFVVIGLDQALHYTALFTTYYLLSGI